MAAAAAEPAGGGSSWLSAASQPSSHKPVVSGKKSWRSFKASAVLEGSFPAWALLPTLCSAPVWNALKFGTRRVCSLSLGWLCRSLLFKSAPGQKLGMGICCSRAQARGGNTWG